MVKILNMDREDFTYKLRITGLPDVRLVPDELIDVPAGQIGELSVDVIVNPDLLQGVNTNIKFSVETTDGRWYASSESRYLGPMPVGGVRGE
jgi:hypothetical protein